MSLFSALNVGVASLQAQMAAIQVAGHNIANANTPGFSRQRVELEAMRPQDWGFAQVGTGVRVASIRRVVDEMLSLRIQTATSTLSNLNVNAQTFQRLEALFNELSVEGGNLSGTMTKFFNSLEDLANNPDKSSARAQVIENGQAMSDMFNTLSDRMREMRESLDKDLVNTVKEVNRIASGIASLNENIVNAENAGNDSKTANDLRDQRDLLLEQLSELVSVKPVETSNGAVNVLVGGNFIVFNKTAYEISTSQDVDRGVLVSTPYFSASGTKLDVRGGSLKGIIESRDTIINQYSDGLDTLARGIMFEINKLHSEGVGLERFTSLTSTEAVLQQSVTTAPLMTEGSVQSYSGRNITDGSLQGYTADFFNGLEIMMTSGPNEGQRRTVVDFDGVTGTLVLDKEFDYAFSPNDTFQITSFNYPIRHGSFDLNVTNELTGAVQTVNINVDLDKSGSDSTLTDIVNEINSKAGGLGITASVTSANKLKIDSSSSNTTFSFANDSSDLLAAVGMNTFFTGEDSGDIAVNSMVTGNSNYLAAAQSNTPSDNANALAMAALKNAKTMQGGMATFEDYYQGIVGTLGVETASAQDQYTGQELLSQQLDNERARISGVNLDEEAVNLIEYQRTYQAAARYISVVDAMLQTLMNSI